MTMFLRILFLLFLIAAVPVASAADAAPSETDLAGITYFAPICPFFYRMMTPEGELIEFQQRPDGRFVAPDGWSAKEADGRIVVRAPKRKQYTFENGRLVNFRHGKKSYDMSYPFEPAYGGEPMSLWGLDGLQAFDDAQADRVIDIWRKNGRLRLWFMNPNAAAALFAELAVVFVALFLFASRSWSIAGLVLALASLAGLGLTGSRGGIIAFGAGLSVMLAVKALRHEFRPIARRGRWLLAVLALAAVFAVATQGAGRFTSELRDDVAGTGKSSDRIELLSAGLRMMVDAPGGWGVAAAGPAYSHWYQSMGGKRWQATMVSDQLTHLVGYGWFGRCLWLFGWLVALAVLFVAAKRGLTPAAPAVWFVLFTASSFNNMLECWELWILPIAAMVWFGASRPWKSWRDYRLPVLLAFAGTAVVMLGLYVAGRCASRAVPPVRSEGRGVLVNGERPERWLVDDGQMLGGIYTQNLIRRHYMQNPQAPAMGYVSSLRDVPQKVRRLVVAGARCRDYLDLLAKGNAPKASELVFISPPFGPRAVPEELTRRCQFRLVIGEFAARYVDVYGERPYPNWVIVVTGAELYVPSWLDCVFGG